MEMVLLAMRSGRVAVRDVWSPGTSVFKAYAVKSIASIVPLFVSDRGSMGVISC